MRPSQTRASSRLATDPILLLAGHSPLRSALERELRALRAQVVCARSGDEGIQKLAASLRPPSIVMLPEPSIRTDEFEEELAELRIRTGSSRLVPIAVGCAPDPERRETLREAGVHLALFAPFGRHALRFQINRALSVYAQREPRGERRAPQEWRTLTWSAGREKAARCYSISTQGAYLVAPRPWVVGSEIELDLCVGDAQRRIDARVLYTNFADASDRPALPRGMAVAFHSIDADLRDAIRQDVAQRQSGLEV